MQTLHFDVITDTYRGQLRSTFVERPNPQNGTHVRGDRPLNYIYNHTTGCMRMVHPDLYASREIAGRAKASPHLALPGDLPAALALATRHLVRYQGDGMDHTERQLTAIRKDNVRLEKNRKGRLPRLVSDNA